MFLTTALCACVILIGLIFLRKPKNQGGKTLPGPTPWPLVGNLLQIGFRPQIAFTKWAKRYGPIYGLKFGLDDAIIVSNHKLIKELLNESVTTGRLGDNAMVMEFTKGPYGIINSSGSTWEAQRKFTVRTLRNFGFAKTTMETMISDEVQILLDWLRKREGLPISGKRIFNAPVINSLWRIVTGERFKWEENIPVICDTFADFFRELMNVSTNGIFFAPVLRFIAPNLFGWNRYVASINKILKLLQESILKHKETIDFSELRDFIDHHLFEINNETDPNSSFYKEVGNANLTAGLLDLFMAGSETSAGSLSWTLLYLSENKEIQSSLQKEIDKVVGSRIPLLSDRVNMPYSEAVISEILRISSIVPCGIPHKTEIDMVFHGYYLPKGASIFANLYAVHHDPKIWGDPETFRPERFLNSDKTKFVQNDALIPFAEGKRKCIGESFGKDTLFLFLTGICQQFDILPDPDNKGKADFEAEFGLFLAPKPFKVIISSRKRLVA